MKLIALAGGIASGKSSVAKALEARGYLLVEHADLLKRLLVVALETAGVYTSVEEIAANKTKYRALLQEYGSAIGFDNGSYILDALMCAGWAGQPAVIDNIRTDAQAREVKDRGFSVVRLNVSEMTRFNRAYTSGVSASEWDKVTHHPIERGLHREMVDYEITSDVLTPEGAADFLIGLGESDA